MNTSTLRVMGLCMVTVSLGWLLPASAAELLPPDRPIPNVIDHYIDARQKVAKVKPAPQADDATVVRRTTLDLIGRIPTAAAARSYVESQDPAKRAELVKRLLASPEFARHGAVEFDVMLRGVDETGPSLRAYLLDALQENRPWDQMFRELLGVQAAAQQPERFVLQRLSDPDVLTRDVSSIFFGINITCAQCHTHPFARSITQDYFFGMKAFFAGPKLSYKKKSGENREIGLLFLNGAVIDTPAGDPPVMPAVKNAKDAKPIVTYRQQLAELALRPENQELFARSIVNRLWFRFHGHGLVMRVDQMHAKNEPSHPELLDWLARDLIAHKYDMRRLVEGLVSSRAYAQSSRWEGTPPPPELFALANLRPLTPMQYGLSQTMAGNPDLLPADLTADALNKKREQLEAEVAKRYGTLIEQPQLDPLQINVNEALKLSNNQALLDTLGVGLARQLAKLGDRRQQLDTAAWAVLSRPPTETELRLLDGYLAQGSPNGPAAEKALRQMVWALLTSAEFRFNH